MIPILNDLHDPPIESARQTLTIGTADLEVAKLLQVPLNSPVAEVRRVFIAAISSGSIWICGRKWIALPPLPPWKTLIIWHKAARGPRLIDGSGSAISRLGGQARAPKPGACRRSAVIGSLVPRAPSVLRAPNGKRGLRARRCWSAHWQQHWLSSAT